MKVLIHRRILLMSLLLLFTLTTKSQILSGSEISNANTGFDFSRQETAGKEDVADYQPDFVFVSNEGVNFGNEGSTSLTGSGPRLQLLGTGSIDGITSIPTYDASPPWVEVSYDFTDGTGGAPISVGELWAVFTRDGNYAVMEITAVPDPMMGTEFSFDYKYQADGSTNFDGGGTTVIEGFETLDLVAYDGVVSLPTGDWEFFEVSGSDGPTFEGSRALNVSYVNDGSVTTPLFDAGQPITFEYYSFDTEFGTSISIDGGSFMPIETITASGGSYFTYTYDPANPGSTAQLKIDVIGINSTDNITLDRFEFTPTAPPAPNTVLSFDGVDDFVEGSNLTDVNDLFQATIEAWVYFKENKAQTVFGRNNFNFEINANGAVFANLSNSTIVGGQTEDGAVPLNTWTHVAVVFDGTQPVENDRVAIYVNGNPSFITNHFSLNLATQLENVPTGNLFIGRSPYAGTNFLNGEIDEARIWDYAKEPGQLLAFKDVRLSGTEPGLLSYFDFEGVPGENIASDMVGVSDGTLTNMDVNDAWIQNSTLTLGDPLEEDFTSPFTFISTMGPDPTTSIPLVFDIGFSEDIVGLDASDFTTSNGFVDFISSENNASFNAEVIPSGQGPVSIALPPGSVSDLYGNANNDSISLTIEYDIVNVEVVGSAVLGDIPLAKEGSLGFSNRWSGVVALTSGSFDFRLNNENLALLGDDDLNDIAEFFGASIVVPSDGVYFISFNADDFSYILNEITTVGFIGSARTGDATGNDDPDTDMIDLGGGQYVLNGIYLYPGDWKLRGNDSWDTAGNWGDDDLDDKFEIGGAEIPVSVEGYYNITADIFTNSYSIDPAPANALSLNGTDQGVTLLEDPTQEVTNYTLEAWFKLNTLPTDNQFYSIISKGTIEGTDINGYTMGVNNTGGQVELVLGHVDSGDGLNAVFVPVDLTTTNWYHMAGTYDGSELQIFLNGQPVGALASTNDPDYVGVDRDLKIGFTQPNGGTGDFFDGAIDEVKVWDIAKNDLQLNQEMYLQYVEDANLVVNFNFDQTGGDAYERVSQVFATNLAANAYSPSGAFTPFTYQATAASENGFTANWDDIPNATGVLFDVSDKADFSSVIGGNIFGNDPSASSFIVNEDLTAYDGLELFYRMAYEDGSFVSPYSEPISFRINAGSALSFDGTDDYVELFEDEVFNGDFTVEAWVYLTDNSDYFSIISKQATTDNSTAEFNLQVQGPINGGNLNFFLGNGTAISEASGNDANDQDVFLNTWTHVAAVVEGNNISLYQNGQLTGTGTFSGVRQNSANPVQIGRYQNAGIIFWPGNIDEVRIWDYARTATDISENTFTTLSGNEAGLIGYYRMDEGNPASDNSTIVAPEINDLSFSGNDGTLQGFAKTGVTSNWITSDALTSGTQPNAPVNFIIYNGPNGEFIFEWDDVSTDETGFTIEYDDDFSFATPTTLITLGANSSSYVETSPPAGSYFRVLATNASGVAASAIEFATPAPFPGYALDFDGGTNFVSIPRTLLSDGLTFSAWIKTTETPADDSYEGNPGMAIFGDTDNNIRTSFGLTGDFLEYNNWDGAWRTITGSIPVNDGFWHHVAVSHSSSGTVTLYVDGQVDNTSAMSYGLIPAVDRIGGSYSDGTATAALWNGLIDEASIYDFEKTDFSDRFDPSLGSETGLIAYYTFDENMGTSLIDRSTNTLNGIIDGAANWVESKIFIAEVTNTNGTGIGSLRAAIEHANLSQTVVEAINFSMTAGPYEIVLTNELPDIESEGLLIDGSSLPSYAFADAANMMAISGAGTAANASGITINAPHVEINGLILTEFLGSPSDAGINVGSDLADHAVIKNNIIHNTEGSGIYINGADSVLISGNWIGTLDGTTPSGVDQHGINTNGQIDGLVIGGNSMAGEGNIISGAGASGSNRNGINLFGSGGGISGIEIYGNYIGTDNSGNVPLGNSLNGINFSGIVVDAVIGDSRSGFGNIISGNADNGILLDDGMLVTIDGNNIGLGADGTTPVGNGASGIRYTNVQAGSKLGVNAPNLIAENTDYGVFVINTNTNGLEISTDNVINCNGISALHFFNAPLVSQPLITEMKSGVIEVYVETEDGNVVNLFSADGCDNNQISSFVASAIVTDSIALFTPTFSPEEFFVAQLHDTETSGDPANGYSELSLPVSIVEVLNTDDANTGSLREAINYANLNERTFIQFNIAGGGPWKIDLATALPDISSQAIVDGASQPGYDVNGTDSLMVILDGSVNSVSGDGLRFTTIDSEVNGLYITGFSGDGIEFNTLGANGFIGDNIINNNGGAGIRITSIDNVSIEANVIGLGYQGDEAKPNNVGITIGTAANDIYIGGNAIAGNTSHGISTNASGPHIIEYNLIGISDAAYDTDFGNGGDGIRMTTAGSHIIRGNQIGYNDGTGIALSGNNHLIEDNLIGITSELNLAPNNTGVRPAITGTMANWEITGTSLGIIADDIEFYDAGQSNMRFEDVNFYGDADILLTSGSNGGILPPALDPLDNLEAISGTGTIGDSVAVFITVSDGLFTPVLHTEVAGDGTWGFDLSGLGFIQDGDSIKALAYNETQGTSAFSNMVVAEQDSAFNFIGPGDYLELADDPTLEPTQYTLETYVYLHQAPGSGNGYTFIQKGTFDGALTPNGYTLNYFDFGSDQQLMLGHVESTNSPDILSVSFTIETEKWYHIAGTYDGSEMKLYVNGIEVGAHTPTEGPFYTGGGQSLKLGAAEIDGGYSDYLNGIMDEVRIWDYARSATEIRDNISTSIQSETGLLASFDFEVNGFNRFFDASGNLGFGNIFGAGFFTTSDALETTFEQSIYVRIDSDGELIAPANGENVPISPILIGESAVLDVFVQNLGLVDLDISGSVSETVTSDYFTILGQPAQTLLGPGESTSFQIEFSPTGTASQASTFAIPNNDPDESPFFDFTLTGSGEEDISLDFDGTDDYVQMPGNAIMDHSGGFSLELWVKAEQGSGAENTVFSIDQNGTGDDVLRFYYLPNDDRFTLTSQGQSNLSSGTGLVDNEWHHFTIIIDPVGDVFLYQDGILVSSGSGYPVPDGTETFTLGADDTDGNAIPDANYFQGELDNLRVWNAVLQPQDIIDYMFSADVSGHTEEPQLNVSYNFNDALAAGGDNSGLTVLVDLYEEANGTLVGFTLNGATSNWVTSGALSYTPVTPSLQASTIIIDNIGENTADISWTNGNGERRIVAVFEGNSAAIPSTVDGQYYNPDASFGAGDLVDGSWHVVYNGFGNSTSITGGLAPGAEYTIAVIEANGAIGQEAYNGNTATDNPNVFTTLAPPNTSLAFDGVDDYIGPIGTVITEDLSGGVSFEFWVKPTLGSGGENTIFSIDQNGAGDDFLRFYYLPNDDRFVLTSSGQTDIMTPQGWVDNEWLHVAIVVDAAGEAQVIIDGIIVGSASGYPLPMGSGLSLIIGGEDAAGDGLADANFFTGELDDFRIWSGALEISDVINHFDISDLSGHPIIGSLLVQFLFDDGNDGADNSGVTEVVDNSGTGNNGTLNGFALTGTTSNFVNSTSELIDARTSAPTTNASNIIPINTTSNNIDLTWTAGDGKRKLVFATIGENLILPNLIDGNYYHAEASYESGDFVDGWYTVYNGFENSTTIESLSQNEVYSIAVVEANGPFGYEEYFIDPSAQNPIKVITSTDQHYALKFDGTDDYVDALSVDIPTGDWTMEAWVLFEGNNSGFYGIMDFPNDDPWFGVNDGKLSVWPHITDPNDFPIGVWTHVAAAFDDAQDSLTLYVNGEKAVGIEYTSTFAGSTLGIGSQPGGAFEVWKGNIDEVRIWDRTLAKSEIQIGLDTEVTGTEPNLAAYFAFNEGPGNGSTFDAIAAHEGVLQNMDINDNWIDGAPIDTAPLVYDEFEDFNDESLPNPTTTGVLSLSSGDWNVQGVSSAGPTQSFEEIGDALRLDQGVGNFIETPSFSNIDAFGFKIKGDNAGIPEIRVYLSDDGGSTFINEIDQIFPSLSYEEYVYNLGELYSGPIQIMYDAGSGAAFIDDFGVVTPPLPDATITSVALTDADITAGTEELIYQFTIAASGGDVITDGFGLSIDGIYDPSDFDTNGFSLLRHFGSDDFNNAELLSQSGYNPGGGAPVDGTGWLVNDTILDGDIAHYYVTAKMATGATPGNSFFMALPILENFGLQDPKNKIDGGLTQGNTFSIVSGDTTPPAITIDFLSTFDGSPQLTGEIDDPSATIEISVDGQTHTATNNGDNTWVLSGGQITSLSEGVYDVTATATDDVGNVGTDDTTDELTIDQTPPSVSVDVLITNQVSPELTGTVSEPTASVSLDIDGNTYVASNNGDGSWTLAAGTITPDLSEQVYQVVATAEDAAGNSFSEAQTDDLTIDLTAPVVGVNTIATNVGSPEIAGTIDDPNATVSVDVEGNTYSAANVGDGTWVLAAGNISPDLTDGVYSIDVTATDEAGNVGTDGSSDELTIDTTSPTVTVNALTTNEVSPELTGSIDDPTANLALVLNGENYTPNNNGDGTWTLTAGTISPDLTEGTYDVAITAEDAAGNTSTDGTTDELSIDLTAPVVAVDTQITNVVSPQITGTIDDAAATLSLDLDGNTYSPTNNGDGTWTLSQGLITPDLSDGVYDVAVTATDDVGNTSNDGSTDELEIDLIAPVVTVDDVISGLGSPELTGTIDDPAAQVNVEVNSNLYVATNNGDGTWTLAEGTIAPDLPGGVYDVMASAVDLAGNTGTDATIDELTIDDVAPVVTVDFLVTNVLSPELTGTVDDITASVSVTVSGSTYSATNNGDGTWTLSAGQITPDLTEQVYDVEVTATDPQDNAGNDATTDELTIDTTPPVITVGLVSTFDDSPELTGTVSDEDATVEITVDGSTYSAAVSGGSWTIAAGTVNSLAVGTYDVMATATDIAGNEASDQTNGELEILPGAPTAIAPADVEAQSFTARWNARAGVSSYELDVASDEAFVNKVSGFDALSTNATSVSVTGLDYQTTYYYRVRAVYPSNDVSLSSNVISVATLLDPGTTLDEAALLSIFNATGGENWTRGNNWDQGLRLDEWDDVELEGGTRVKRVNLSSNNLTGSFPAIVSGLEELEVLELNDNELTEVADLSNLTSLTELDIRNNRLEFGSIEPNRNVQGVFFNPQDSVGVRIETLEQVGTEYVINREVSGSANTYTWFKQNLVNGSISELTNTGPSLTIDIQDFSDDGAYYAVVSSEVITTMDLVTQPVILKVSSLERDFAALRVIYEKTNGTAWTTQTNWLDDSRTDWAGVALNDDETRVETLNLSGFGVEGTIPKDILDIEQIVTINLSNNRIVTIPNFSNMASLTTLNVSQNRLEFDDMEKNNGVTGRNFANQARIGTAINETITAGENYTLQVNTPGTANTYQWSLVSPVSSGEIDGAESPVYEIQSINYEKMGTYTLRVKNSIVTDVTLTSLPMQVYAKADLKFEALDIDGNPLTEGFGDVLKVTAPGSPYDSIQQKIEPIAGVFNFDELRLGDYLVAIEGDPEVYLPTYFRNTDLWVEADILQLRDSRNETLTMTVVPGARPPLPDGGIVQGTVEREFPDEEEGGRILGRRKAKRAGCSIRRLVRKGRVLQEDSTFVLYAYVQSDDEGRFEITDIEPGFYRFNIEYPGIPMDSSSFVQFEIGADGVEQNTLVLEAVVTDDGIVVERINELGFYRRYFKDLNVYPNPADEVVHITYQKLLSDEVEVRLIDLNGRVIHQQLMQSGYDQQLELDVSSIENGIYLLNFIDLTRGDRKVVTMKVYVRH